MRLLISILFLTLICHCSYANRDTIELRKKLDRAVFLQQAFNPKAALKLMKSIEQLAVQSYQDNIGELAPFYYYIASCHLDLAQYKEAKEYLDKTIAIFELHRPNSIALADTYMLYGIYYDYMAEYDRALAYYDLTKEIYLQKIPQSHWRFGYLFNNIGICIFFKGDVERALGFFNKTITITVENSGIQSTKLSRDLTNASLCDTKLNRTDAALDKLAQSLAIGEANNILDSYVGARIYHSLSVTHYELARYQEALQYGEKAHELRIRHFHPKHIEVAKGYYSQAEIFMALGEWKKARSYFEKAEVIYSQLFDEYHPEIAAIYYSYSSIALSESQLNSALEKIDHALRLFKYDEHIAFNTGEDFDHQILSAIELKAKIHFKLWEQTDNINHLKKSNKIYGDLILLVNQIRFEFEQNTSKELLAEEFFHLFDSAIEVSYNLILASPEHEYKTQAFERAEFSSAYVLLEHIRNTAAKYSADLPDSLLQKEQTLRTAVSSIEKKLNGAERQSIPDQTTIFSLRAELFEAGERHTSFIKELEKHYPTYQYLKKDITIISLDSLQQNLLAPDQSLVEYFIGKQYLYIIVIDQENFTLKRMDLNFSIQSLASTLRQSIDQYQYPFNLGKEYHENLVKNSGQLYNTLIRPVEDLLKQRLVIIAGGALSEIPFECLIKVPAENASAYGDHDYLVHHHAISYCYSATLLGEMTAAQSPDKVSKALAFAPSFTEASITGNFRSPNFLPLKYNEEEVESIAKITNGTTIIGTKATESQFLSIFDRYDLLHFATHAKADQTNSDFSFLAFSTIDDDQENELLYVKDIYNLPIKANMVTLSACETGIGENIKGEGVISLARSFAYAGSKNVNTSLWQVNDRAMSKLMESFYSNLADNQDKDIALQKAKLTVLAHQKTHSDAHPFYWTAMITIGDTSPLIFPDTAKAWILVILLMLSALSIAVFLYKRYLKRAPFKD